MTKQELSNELKSLAIQICDAKIAFREAAIAYKPECPQIIKSMDEAKTNIELINVYDTTRTMQSFAQALLKSESMPDTCDEKLVNDSKGILALAKCMLVLMTNSTEMLKVM